MNATQKTFQQIKEKRLERLIAGGWLKRPNARRMLCGFVENVRTTLKRLED